MKIDATRDSQLESAQYVAMMLAEQCAMHCEEDIKEFSEEEITEMYYDHLLRELAHETWPKRKG